MSIQLKHKISAFISTWTADYFTFVRDLAFLKVFLTFVNDPFARKFSLVRNVAFVKEYFTFVRDLAFIKEEF